MHFRYVGFELAEKQVQVHIIFGIHVQLVKIIIGPCQQGIGDECRPLVAVAASHHKGLEGIHVFPVHAHHRKIIGGAVQGGPESLAHCIFHPKKHSGAVRVHDHVFLPAQDIPLIQITAIHHIHRLYILVIVINALVLELDFCPLIGGFIAGKGAAVNIRDLVAEGLLGPLHLIQVKIVALPYVIHPVSNGKIGLGNSHILIQIRKQPPHGIADGYNGYNRTNADDDSQHGQGGTHFIGADG